MTFWALLLLILCLAALVAYLGDRVAKWAGKRHYRLFGLRPRQTATLIAVFTGVGIALFSYLAFLLVFREAREVILEATAIRRERDALRAERDALLQAKSAMEAEAARALAELNALRGERRELSEALAGAEAVRRRLEAEAEALSRQVRALGEERQALLGETERLKAEREELLALLALKNKELGERSRELQGLEARLKALQEAAKGLEAERRRLQEELAKAQARLEAAREERARLAQEAEGLRATLERTRRELRQAEERLLGLLTQAEVLQREKGQLAQSLVRLSQGLYLGEVRLGAEEGRAVLERVAERRALLQGFKGAELLGEAVGPGLAVLEGAGYQEGRLLVRVRFYPERRAFAEGEVLASATFRLSTQARNQEVLERLGEEARKRLLEAGFPPEYATFPAPEELARGLALLKGRQGVVRVGVVAERELWTTERPLLAFRLLGGPPGPEVPVPTRKVP
ncbi:MULTISPECIES: DUF3084 domain-containing protein [Thermus]|uniref:DUF3084 domain-containing protein n=1 Tax=Thermus TaxID=270 RepID=UPI001F467FD3|nr:MULTISPECIES: DUF3084 domain-containing protein [Thermus]